MSTNLFISHTSSDRELAAEVARELSHDGFLADFGGPEPGESLPERILDDIERSDAVIILLSSTAATSPSVMVELGAARVLNKRIIAVRPRRSRVPEPLRDVETVAVDHMSARDIASSIRAQVSA